MYTQALNPTVCRVAGNYVRGMPLAQSKVPCTKAGKTWQLMMSTCTYHLELESRWSLFCYHYLLQHGFWSVKLFHEKA